MPTKQIWFKHDLNARNDIKLVKVKRLYGLEGIGIFWCLVELMYENKGELTKDDIKDFVDFNSVNMETVIGVCKVCFKVKNGKLFSERVERDIYCGSKKMSYNNEPRKVTEPDWMKEEK